MFRDDHQRAAACRALLATFGQGDLWTETGPSPRAADLFESNGGGLSSGERIFLFAAFAFWNGAPTVPLADVFDRLDAERAMAVLTLAAAVVKGAAAIDGWIASRSRSRIIPRA